MAPNAQLAGNFRQGLPQKWSFLNFCPHNNQKRRQRNTLCTVAGCAAALHLPHDTGRARPDSYDGFPG
jgi:hypothetical protein